MNTNEIREEALLPGKRRLEIPQSYPVFHTARDNDTGGIPLLSDDGSIPVFTGMGPRAGGFIHACSQAYFKKTEEEEYCGHAHIRAGDNHCGHSGHVDGHSCRSGSRQGRNLIMDRVSRERQDNLESMPFVGRAVYWLENHLNIHQAVNNLTSWLTAQVTLFLRSSFIQIIVIVLTFYLLFYFSQGS